MSGRDLAAAIDDCDDEETRRLLRNGCNPLALDRPGGRAVIFYAVNEVHYGEGGVLCDMLLYAENICLGTAASDGNTVLHYAAEYLDVTSDERREAVAERLGRPGVDVNTKGWNERTALYCAAAYNNTEFADLLLELGADPRARDADGSTALHAAALRQNSYMVHRLIELGADVNAVNKHGDTPLHKATLMGTSGPPREDIIRLLVKHGADTTARNSENCAPGYKGRASEDTRVLLRRLAEQVSRASQGAPHEDTSGTAARGFL